VTDLIQDAVAVRADTPASPTQFTAALSSARPLGFRLQAIYGSGALVETVINAALTNFHLIYLTAVCGLSGTLAGASAFAALVIDAFVDPLIGWLSDNTQTRWGRRHPYMLVAALPVTIFFGLLFSIPASFKGGTLFIYATAILLCMRFALSAYVVPYMSMGGELTDDYHGRSVVVAYRHAFGIMGGLLPVVIGLPLFLRGDNLLMRSAYVPYVWTCAAVVLAGALITCLGSADTIALLKRHARSASAEKRHLGREIAEVFKNPSFRVLFSCLLIFFIAQGAAGVLAVHAGKFFWKMPGNVIAATQIAVPVGSAIGIPIILALAGKIEKKTIVLSGQVAFCLVQGVWPLLRIAGVLPPNGPALYSILISNGLVAGVVVTALVIGFQSMMADAADEHDFRFGVRREGIYFAGLSFSVKVTAGIGVLIAGIALDAIGFPTAWIAAHPHSVVSLEPLTLRNLGLIAGPMPAVITAVCIAITSLYRIDRKRHAEIQETLAERKRVAAQSSPPGV
jgi:GPH family glycoside/pentoside/hexuronide:cation symporter